REAKVRDAAAKLRRPLLVMHSPVDDVVSIDNATGLFLAAKHPKSFVSLDRAGHLLSKREDTDYVIDVIDGWSRRYLETPAASAAPSANGVVRVSETGGPSPYQNAVQIDGRTFLADEPVSIGGGDTGPNPYQFVSAGLGACTSITLRMYADRKQWPLEKVQERLGGLHTKQALQMLKEGNRQACCKILLEHYYDKTYLHGLSKRPPENIYRIPVSLKDTSDILSKLQKAAVEFEIELKEA
ncbi:MAG: OsmC family protein, partial [Calditrichota bacterium]